MSDRPAPIRRPPFAFLAAIPIALLGGLIGLGGAEFRLPVLAGPLRYAAKQAVPVDLANLLGHTRDLAEFPLVARARCRRLRCPLAFTGENRLDSGT